MVEMSETGEWRTGDGLLRAWELIRRWLVVREGMGRASRVQECVWV